MASQTTPPTSDDASYFGGADRLRADVHRAVGGALNLVREISRISFHLDGSIPMEWMIKRVQFLSYELQTQLPYEPAHPDPLESSLSEAERLGILNRFFFTNKNFSCVEWLRLSERGLQNAVTSGGSTLCPPRGPSDPYRLDRVLITRTGAPMVLELIYAFLAEKIGVSLDFVDLKPLGFLRWQHEGRARYIDITRQGATLSSDELIETLHSRFQLTSIPTNSAGSSGLLEALSFESYITDYVSALKSATDAAHEPEKILFLQDTLISYQPSNLQLVGERALLHRRLGNFKNALSDLKRYFAFHDKQRAPVELARLHDELIQLLDRKPENLI